MKTRWMFAAGMGLWAAGMFLVSQAITEEFYKKGLV